MVARGEQCQKCGTDESPNDDGGYQQHPFELETDRLLDFMCHC